jgi:hypothetical protein
MAGAGYKLFNTGDVLTAAQVNTYLNEQTVMVFASSTARTTALSGVLAEGMVSYLQDTNAVEVYNGSAWVSLAADQTPLTTKGDLFGFSTVDARIPIGTNGHVLTADSAQTLGLKWAALPASGKVLQVVGAANSTEISNSTSTYADTGTTATITPTSATSKILVIVMQGGLYKDAGNSENQIQLRLLRAAAEIGTTYNNYTQSALRLTTTSGILMKLDDPATTSATTYKTQFKCVNNTASVAVQINGSLSSIVLLEIGA